MGYIYIIKNDINDKVYIGMTTQTLQHRWQEHLEEVSRSKDRPLYRAMRKHGVNHFHMELLEEADNNSLSEREIYWIGYYNSYKYGYNATRGGEGNLTFNLTQEQCEELINRYPNQTATFYSEKVGCCVATLLKYFNKYNILYLYNSNRGKIINNHKTAVNQIDLNTHEIIQSFLSITEAAKWLINNNYTTAKLSSVTCAITRVCTGERNKAYNFKWVYNIY